MASVLLASRLVLTKEENMLLFVCSEAVESKLVELETRRIAENAHHRMEYHCTSDVLLNSFGFDQTSKSYCRFNKSISAESKQNKQVSRTVIPPIMLVFSAYSDTAWPVTLPVIIKKL